MDGQKRRDGSAQTGASSGPFLQPLVVALVSLILVSLALISGLMDLRTLDRTLVGYLEKRGLEIIRTIQQAARHNFQAVNQGSRSSVSGPPGTGITDEAFSLKEAMVVGLMDLAQRIDFEMGSKGLSEKELASTAAREGLYTVALVDDEGKVTLSNRPVPGDLLAAEEPVIMGKREIRVALFSHGGGGRDLGSLALRRKWGKGSIILALDQGGLLFWMARISLQRAVEEANPGPDTGYFVVMDGKGRVVYHWVEDGVAEDESGPALDAAVKGRIAAGSKFDLGGRKMLEVVAPLSLGPGAAFNAHLSLSRATADRMLKKEWARGIAFMGFMAFIAVIAMWFLYRNQNRHLARMREMERRLQHAERLSAMGRLAAGVAHEIRNPLNAMSMAVQRLTTDNLPELRRIIRDEIGRLNRIVEDFVAFSRVRNPEPRYCDTVELVRQMAVLMREEASARGITLDTDLPRSPLMAWIDFDKMKQALLNVVRNAMESISGPGAITVSVRPRGGTGVKIAVSDTGRGLDRQELDQIFNPDYTTKEKGLGLGLALCHEIVQAHWGEIRVRSKPGVGTTFELLLPVHPANPEGS